MSRLAEAGTSGVTRLLPSSTHLPLRQHGATATLRAMWNSAVVSIIVTVAQLGPRCSRQTPSRSCAPRQDFLLLSSATLLVPFEATVSSPPTRRTRLLKLQGVAVPFLATAFGTFLCSSVHHPATELLGRTAWTALPISRLREVAVPLVRPTLGALALFGFLSTWNQYLWPTLISTEDDWNTVQSVLRTMSRSQIDRPNLVIAGTVIVALPIAVVLLAFQRQLVRGLTAGAVKG